MKKPTAAFLIALLGCAFLGDKLDAAEAPQKIGIAWEGKSSVAEKIVKGFGEAMKTLAPQTEIELQKDLKDIPALETMAKQFEKDKQAILLLRSSGAKLLGKTKLSVPSFFGACDDPVALGALKNPNAPEGNCSGVTYAIPYATQIETLSQVLPQMKSVLLLLEEGHPTSGLIQSGTQAACASLKIAYADKTCKTKEDILAAAKEAETQGSVIIVGSQALMMANAGAIAATIKVPMVSYTEKPVLDGALCGVVADDVKLGAMLAESVLEVIAKGKAIKDVPVKTDPKPQLVINVAAAKRLGLDIPFEILQTAKIIEK
jgi:putative ABC transport system substrate-binding protein